MFKYYKNLKDYCLINKIGYSHYVHTRKKGELKTDDLLKIPKGCLYIDKKSLLIELLKEV